MALSFYSVQLTLGPDTKAPVLSMIVAAKGRRQAQKLAEAEDTNFSADNTVVNVLKKGSIPRIVLASKYFLEDDKFPPLTDTPTSNLEITHKGN